MNYAQAILKNCEAQSLTLALAESCTGGNLAAAFTKIPGASKSFLGSLVTYQNNIKTQLLGVPDQLLKEKGAVNEEVVLLMLKGVQLQFDSTCAIAVTGYAGPTGGTEHTPIGTVYVAMSKLFKSKVIVFNLSGNRINIIRNTVKNILINFYHFLSLHQK